MKQMKLIVLFVVALFAQPAYADKKVDMAKKAGRVACHTGKLVAGLGMIFYHRPLSFKPVAQPVKRQAGDTTYFDNHGGTYKSKDEGESNYKERCNDYLREHFLYALLSSLFGIDCCFDGVRGLNQELKISERAKRLADRIRKRKVSAA